MTTVTATTAAPNTTAPGGTQPPSSTEEKSTASSQTLQWYHVTAGVAALFVIVGGACYVTLMWQQNAIREYKGSFEEHVKAVGLKRANLAEQWKAEREEGGGRVMRVVEPEREDVLGFAARVDESAGAAGKGPGPSGGDTSAPLVTSSAAAGGVGRLHTFGLRTAQADRAAQERAAESLSLQMRRQQRDAEVAARQEAAGESLLGQSVFEAVGVDHNIAALERRAQWRSLRSLDL